MIILNERQAKLFREHMMEIVASVEMSEDRSQDFRDGLRTATLREIEFLEQLFDRTELLVIDEVVACSLRGDRK